MSDPRPDRRGGVLIVVIGLSAMILTLTMTYLARIRSSGDETRLVLAEAQARLMLHAALMYLQEGSRLGWSDRIREASAAGTSTAGWRGHPGTAGSPVANVADHGGETFGWTDLRTGWLGPLGPRDPATGAIPAPRWWTAQTTTPYRPMPDDTDLPPMAGRVWPCPGSTVRCEVQRQHRPPRAVLGLAAPNPLRPADAVVGSATFDLPWSARPPGDLLYHADYLGALDPQPVSDRVADFLAGDPTVVEATRNLAWFRIYREVLADHDNDGDPWYDRVAISDAAHAVKNWNVFVISAGAGGSRGYRSYDDAPPGLFLDRAHFDEVRAAERILWFRVEWTGMQGGSWAATAESRDGRTPAYDQQTNSAEVAGFTARSAGGGFRWIQRLDREPPRW